MRTKAALTAALAPRKRTYNASCAGSAVVSCTHALAFKGKGWPPQRLSKSRASCCDTPGHANVACAGAMGNTLSETSVINPNVPKLPAISRETS